MRIVTALTDWIDQQVTSCGTNTSIVIGGDLNDGLGQTPKGEPRHSWAVGPGGAPERLPGGAGQRVRELAERHHLFA
eukprot:6543538-Pyramimonas_sp.AAC.1